MVEERRATILGEQRVRFFAIFARLETGIGFRNFQRARTDSDDQSQLRRDCSWLGKEADSDVLRKQIEVKGESISFDESPVLETKLLCREIQAILLLLLSLEI